MCVEAEGIFLWALEGLKRLIANDYRFTISEAARENMEEAISYGNNIVDFLQSEGYIGFKADYEARSSDLYEVYKLWCRDNAENPFSMKTFISYLKQNTATYGLEYTNEIHYQGSKVRGFLGIYIERKIYLLTVTRGSYERCRMELLKGLPRRKIGGMVTEALYYWNVLYLMGRQPNVKCWSQEFTSKAKIADLMEQYRVYFRIFGIEDSVSVPYMEQFFAQREKNGEVTDECRMNYALIYWTVP